MAVFFFVILWFGYFCAWCWDLFVTFCFALVTVTCTFCKVMDRKKLKCLTLKEKADCLKEIRSGVSVTALANKYNVAKSTICGIKKKEQQILKCVNNTFSGPGKRQTLKTSELPKMEKALYSWFLSQRNKNYPINGLILKQKAKELHSKLKENNSNFFASDGWLQRFKKRYGIRLLTISGEKLSSRPELVEPFKKLLQNKIKEMGISMDQIYNADESGLYWKLLPGKSYVSIMEKQAPGRKTEKQRLTFLACANATGKHKIKMVVIGRAKNPRVFKNFNCPVEYKSSKSAWMTSFLFKNWFHSSFVPQVSLLI